MPKVTKPVAFYDTVLEATDPSTNVTTSRRVDADFWQETLNNIVLVTDHTKRIHKRAGKRFYGQVIRPTSPPIRHLQIGRLRDLSDNLEQTDLSTGDVQPLVLPDPNLRVSEPTFVVPFGTAGRVAILSPGRSTRQETIGAWLTAVQDLAPEGKSIRFRPVIDEDALAKVLSSQGAVSVEFNVEAGSILDTEGDIPLLDAVDSVLESGPSVGTVTIAWSLGLDGGTIADRNLIKKIAAKIASEGLARWGRVNLIVEKDGGELRREQHDLLEDAIVAKIQYMVEADSQTSSGLILDAIQRAIHEFNQRPSV